MSDPSGAMITMNGEPTGQVTPSRLYIRNIPLGDYMVSVCKEGYRTLTPPQPVYVSVAPGSIITTVIFGITPFPWIKNLAGNRWKYGDFVEFDTFMLVKETDPSRSPQEGSTIEERFRTIERLHRDGFISDEEYERKRRLLLDQL